MLLSGFPRRFVLTGAFLSVFFALSAQSPNAIPYQAVARNSAGNLLQNQPVRVRFSIHEGTASGTVVYQETHTATTNNLGLFSVNIGQGSPVSGTFAGINWGSGLKFTQVELDPAGGTAYLDMGTVQMLSVPYALYAASSGNAANESDPQVSSATTNAVPKWNGTTLIDGQIYDNGSSVGIGTSSPAQKLDVVGTVKTVGFQMPTGAGTGLVLQSDASGNASWVNPTSLTVTGDNLGNHTASQNINLGSRFLSNNGSDYGLQFYNGLTYSQLGTSASFNLGNSTNPFTEMSFRSQDRSWLLNAGGDKFQLLDGTNGNSAPFVVEKQSANDRLHINGNYVGIGTSSPAELLDVNGRIKTGNLQMTSGAVNGYVLRSDASGNASWVSSESLSIIETDPQVVSGNTNYVSKWNGSALTDGQIYDNGSSVGIGTSSPAQKLDVVGTVKTVGFQMPTGAGTGLVLQSDASGNASWVNPTSLTVTGDNLGNHTASQNINLGSRFLSNNGSDYGLRFYGGLTYSQSGTSASFNLGNSTNPFAEMSFQTQDRSWLLNAGGDKFQLLDGTNSNSAPFVVEKQSANDRLHISGNYVGIGTSSPAELLDVNGRTKTTNLQMTSGAASGYVLQSDGSGNASWVAPSSVFTTTDDQTLSLSGTTLSILDGNSVDISQKALTDADTDTKIEVEKNTDEDKIRFTLGGTEYFEMNGPHLNVKNSGGSVFLGQYAGQNDDLDASDNVGIGTYALSANTTGFLNTALGKSALASNVSGTYNVAVGNNALNSITTTGLNTAIGSSAGANATGTANVFIGYGAGENETTNDKLYIHNSNSTSPLIWGDFVTRYLNVNGNLGIGTTTPSQKLDVVGTAKVTNFQMTNGAANGYVLQSDASGNAAWASPSSTIGAALTAGYLPRWDGSDLVNSDVFNNGSTITIGTTTPNSIPDDDNALEIWNEGGTRSDINQVVAGDGVAVHYFTRQQGTLAAPTSVQADNTLGRISARLYNGTAYLESAAIVFKADEDPSGDAPGRIEFRTTAVGEQDYSTRMTIKNDGKVGIGTTTPDDELEVNGTIETDNFQMNNGATSGYVLQSDASGNASWVAPSTLSTATPAKIQDADANTKIQTEESSNEDKIRFDLGGTEQFVMDGPHLQVKNSGNSVFIGDGAGSADDLTGNHNAFIGFAAGLSTTTGNSNVALGSNALRANATGSGSVALGYQALYSSTESGNVAIGALAGQNCTGAGSVFIGYFAGQNETGSGKLYIDNSNTTSPLIWGDFSSNYLNFNANVGIGTTSPSNQLDIQSSGSATASVQSSGSTAYSQVIAPSGNEAASVFATYSSGSASNRWLIGKSNAAESGSNAGSDFFINRYSDAGAYLSQPFYIQRSTGNIGIGSGSPTQAKLVISGSESQNLGGYGFINDNGNTGTSSGTHNYSIYASDRIAGSEFNAHSDARIKHVQGRSDNAADLQTLMQLKITDYTMVDTVAKGSKPYKKVIAQEVEQVYPQAVSTMAGVAVPDIYQLSKIENGFVALANSGLKVGERVKLIFGEKQTIAEVTAVSEKGFQTNLTTEHGQVFVFGHEVSDFRTVDYEAISMLNVSATQELNKQMEALRQENTALQARVKELEGLGKRLEALEAMLGNK